MAKKRQEQFDAVGAVAAFVRSTVEKDLAPPRPVDAVQLLAAMYRGRVTRGAILLGITGGLFALTFYQPGSSATEWLLRLLWGFGILLWLFGPARNAPTVRRWARDGLLATASVTEAHMGVTSYSRRVPEVRGRRVVHHPLEGDFHDEFGIVSPWIGEVTAGSTLDVLVAPEERRTWYTLGPG